MTRAIFLIAALCSVGCASSVFKRLDASLASLEGRPLSAAVAALGFPSGDVTLDGERFYVWRNSSVLNTTVGATPMAIPLDCEIAIAVDDDDIIRSATREGEYGACARFDRALAP